MSVLMDAKELRMRLNKQTLQKPSRRQSRGRRGRRVHTCVWIHGEPECWVRAEAALSLNILFVALVQVPRGLSLLSPQGQALSWWSPPFTTLIPRRDTGWENTLTAEKFRLHVCCARVVNCGEHGGERGGLALNAGVRVGGGRRKMSERVVWRRADLRSSKMVVSRPNRVVKLFTFIINMSS